MMGSDEFINRQDAIDAIYEHEFAIYCPKDEVSTILNDLPSTTLGTPISYYDCANAMLKMWMDDVLTDGEYSKIMDKLNAYHGR